MLADFIQCLTDFYIENSTKDNILTITNRKILQPHLHSFLQLIETTNDDELKQVNNQTFI